MVWFFVSMVPQDDSNVESCLVAGLLSVESSILNFFAFGSVKRANILASSPFSMLPDSLLLCSGEIERLYSKHEVSVFYRHCPYFVLGTPSLHGREGESKR